MAPLTPNDDTILLPLERKMKMKKFCRCGRGLFWCWMSKVKILFYANIAHFNDKIITLLSNKPECSSCPDTLIE